MEFFGGRVEGLFLHPVPTADVGLQVHCPILGGGRDGSSVSCDGTVFLQFIKISLPAPNPAQCPVLFCELSLVHEAPHSSPHFKLGSLVGWVAGPEMP